MALVKRTSLSRSSTGRDDEAMPPPHRRLAAAALHETANGHASNGHDDGAVALAASTALAET